MVLRGFCGTMSQGEVLVWVNQKRNLASRGIWEGRILILGEGPRTSSKRTITTLVFTSWQALFKALHYVNIIIYINIYIVYNNLY